MCWLRSVFNKRHPGEGPCAGQEQGSVTDGVFYTRLRVRLTSGGPWFTLFWVYLDRPD